MLDALEWPLMVSNYIQFENKFSRWKPGVGTIRIYQSQFEKLIKTEYIKLLSSNVIKASAL